MTPKRKPKPRVRPDKNSGRVMLTDEELKRAEAIATGLAAHPDFSCVRKINTSTAIRYALAKCPVGVITG